jgi:hypothetical protein
MVTLTGTDKSVGTINILLAEAAKEGAAAGIKALAPVIGG